MGRGRGRRGQAGGTGGRGGERLAGQEPGGVLAPTGKEPVPAQPRRLRESRRRWAEHTGPDPGPDPGPSSRRPPWAPRSPSVPRGGRGAQLREGRGALRGEDRPRVICGTGGLGGGPAAWVGVREERVKAAGLGEDGDAEPVCAAGRASRSHSIAA